MMTPEQKAEKNRARAKAWARANPEWAKARGQAWRAAHSDAVKAKSSLCYQANKRRHLVQGKAWRAANRDKDNEGGRTRYRSDLQKSRARTRNKMRRAAAELSDSYVRSVIAAGSRAKAANVPDGMIPAYRAYLTVLRTIRQLTRVTP